MAAAAPLLEPEELELELLEPEELELAAPELEELELELLAPGPELEPELELELELALEPELETDAPLDPDPPPGPLLPLQPARNTQAPAPSSTASIHRFIPSDSSGRGLLSPAGALRFVIKVSCDASGVAASSKSGPSQFVMPAQAGIHFSLGVRRSVTRCVCLPDLKSWISARESRRSARRF